VTETDLITADGSNENVDLPQTVTSDISTPAEPDASNGASTAETAKTAPTADVASGDRPASLSTMVLPELRALAKEVGVEGASGMRKGELVAAIRERRGDSNGRRHAATGSDANDTATPAADTATDAGATDQAAEEQTPPRRERRGASRGASAPAGSDESRPEPDQQKKADTEGDRPLKQDTRSDGGDQQGDQGGQNRGQNRGGDDDDEGRGGRRGRRFRDRRRRERGAEGGGGGDRDTELREDDVVQPVAGILDVLDNYAFVRTSGYLAGPNDVYVSMNMVRKNGLRRGDAITGAVRVPKDGEQPNQRQKFNPLVRLDTVNGGPVEDAKKRPDFNKLTPLYPNQRLRLETTPDRLTTRVIDLIMPIGKGQRALIVSPPKAGKTTILQDIANGVAVNNPECHLMVVLVDERPEEVTDMQRSVKGEVIASTFDRPPSDHTQAAELAIERAKRLVEQGKDVIVLLDSITRLGRAYNNASPASGRILSGGVDSTALYPPKRFLGAARNIEYGGSLTIIATAMVETGSTGDTVIFEEFKGTGNAELKLDRKISERRVFPAVDVNPSGTRKDELLLSTDEFAVVHKLRRVLSGLDPHQAIDLLMSQLRKTKTNYEFLVQVSKTTPNSMDSD
jgi:transcription termination factor Rho